MAVFKQKKSEWLRFRKGDVCYFRGRRHTMRTSRMSPLGETPCIEMVDGTRVPMDDEELFSEREHA